MKEEVLCSKRLLTSSQKHFLLKKDVLYRMLPILDLRNFTTATLEKYRIQRCKSSGFN